MTDFQRAGADEAGTVRPDARRPYVSPALVFFGQVAALTQSKTGCSMDDNVICDGGGGMGPAMSSERALKHNIRRVGTHPLGIGLYLFDYLPGRGLPTGRQFGVMADEVEAVRPEAVRPHPTAGHKTVDYALLGIRLPH